MKAHATVLLWICLAACTEDRPDPTFPVGASDAELDAALQAELADRGFTGTIEAELEARLGRPVDAERAELGRLLFFDPVTSLTGDNSCSGCHGPNMSFGDSKAIAIGVDNNGVVGPGRQGPHNLRRAPSIINAAFYPRLMWDARFASASTDPFDNTRGYDFPPPEGRDLSHLDHLLAAQAFTPVVSRAEMAGDAFEGDHDAMRDEIVRRIEAVDEYRERFAEVYPDVRSGEPLRFDHVGSALAEFTFTLVRADAPIDRYARGETRALTSRQKRGALLFFGRAECGECHIVKGFANQMFSDFEPHVLGVPQLVPTETNMTFDGPGQDEDFGEERVTGNPADRYKFRTSTLRNAVFQQGFMHNGAYRCLEDAIRHHLDVFEVLRSFSTAGLGPGIRPTTGPMQPVLERLHPLVQFPAKLTDGEFQDVLAFVRDALADPDAHPDRLRHLIPSSVPSGLPVHDFQFHAPSPGCVS